MAVEERKNFFNGRGGWDPGPKSKTGCKTLGEKKDSENP